MSQYDVYNNPLITRYASKEMQAIFSPNNRYLIWRKLWLALAGAQKLVGLNISMEQIKQLEDALSQKIDFDAVAQYEQITNHEVMAHIKAYADVAPEAEQIIHLGETSAYVIDNSDIIINRQAIVLIQEKMQKILKLLSEFADKYKGLPCLSFTHLQPAQPITIGKRGCLWLNSLVSDYKENQHIMANLKLRGVKGATGSAASFKKLLNGNYQSLKAIDQYIAKAFDFDGSYSISSQTYDRKIDITIGNQIAQCAVSLHKITNDLRLLQHMGEISEPFSDKQVGSSAMPYKRNPMLSERVSSLCKFILSTVNSTTWIASTQWLERTLDDSANKRLVLPQCFLALDGCLDIMTHIIENIFVNETNIMNNLNNKLPFMITENILMHYVSMGNSRQDGHEKIRQYSMEAIKLGDAYAGKRLLELLEQDDEFCLNKNLLESLLNPTNLTGFCQEQVEEFLNTEILPLIKESA